MLGLSFTTLVDVIIFMQLNKTLTPIIIVFFKQGIFVFKLN